MKNLTWQNPEQLFVAQELINKVKSKCCGIKVYNVSDIKLLGTEDERHQGWGTGVGLSYGYSWVLGKHWNLEASVGAGYLYLKSDIYPCTNCGTKKETVKKHYFGPTQAAVSAVYVF